MSTLLAATNRMPVRLDLSAPSERSYVPLQLPRPLEVVLCPIPFVHIATYARVSSDEQRDRHTVLNQRAALSRRLGSEPGVFVFRHYEDDGVSGTVPLEDRPAGRALVA